jgi:membrane fusion protein (multidrug efflux system)
MKTNCRHLVALVLPLLALAACGPEEKSAGSPPPPEVLVTEAATRDVPVYRDWIGTLDGSENAEIRARVTGYLLRRDYQEGGVVKKGDLLFEIDPRPFEAALAEAKSQREQAKAVQLASQSEADRNKELFNKKVISETEYINKTQVNEANLAKVAASQASVEESQLNLNFCRVTAPVDGISGVAQAQVGDLVGTGANAVLTTVSTLDPIKILFPVSESDYLEAIARVQETMNKPLDQRPESIELILADGSIFPQKARLLSVDRQVKASTGTILVTALLANPGNVLRPGFFARARIVADILKNAVVVPQRAVAEVQGSYQLGIVGGDNKAEIRPVKVGARTGSDWVISSGLKPGEKVVVEGLQKIKAGAPVTAKAWTAPPPPAAAPPPPVADVKPAAQPEAK